MRLKIQIKLKIYKFLNNLGGAYCSPVLLTFLPPQPHPPPNKNFVFGSDGPPEISNGPPEAKLWINPCLHVTLQEKDQNRKQAVEVFNQA